MQPAPERCEAWTRFSRATVSLSQFGKDAFVEIHAADDGSQANLKIAFVVGHLLFAEVQHGGDFLVGQAANKNQLNGFELGPAVAAFPSHNLFANGIANGGFLNLFSFHAARSS